MIKMQSNISADLQVEVIDCEVDQSKEDDESSPISQVNSETMKKEQKEKQNENLDKKRNKNLPEPTEAFNVFQNSLKFLATFGYLLGADMNYEWKYNTRFYILKAFIVIFWILNIYTQLSHFYKHENKETLEQFALYGTALSGMLKVSCYEEYFKNIAALYESTNKICQQNNGIRGEILSKHLQANHSFYQFLCCLLALVIVIYVYFPVKSYIIDGVLVPLLPMQIMFIDQSTEFGLFLTNIALVVIATYGLSTITFVGMSFAIAIMNYGPCVDLVEIDFKELDELWSGTSGSISAQRHLILRNICKKFIDFREYISEIKQIYEPQLFLFFSFTYVSQIVCLYLVRANNWIYGYSFVLGTFLEMIFYCAMGTKITIENERLFYIITQSRWYTYDVQSQKLILILLNLSMNSEEMWIGSLKPLNVFTATEITKSIYSYCTVMSEILD